MRCYYLGHSSKKELQGVAFICIQFSSSLLGNLKSTESLSNRIENTAGARNISTSQFFFSKEGQKQDKGRDSMQCMGWKDLETCYMKGNEMIS